MKTIKNREELKSAILSQEGTIFVDNSKLGDLLILTYRIQNGFIPDIVINRIISDRPCKIAVGEGVIINVDDTLAKEARALNQKFEDLSIELDVAEVVKPQINLYYGQ